MAPLLHRAAINNIAQTQQNDSLHYHRHAHVVNECVKQSNGMTIACKSVRLSEHSLSTCSVKNNNTKPKYE